jgi:hypothetical protein
MDKLFVVIVGIVGIVAIVVVMALLFAYPTMWLWNDCLVGVVDGIHPINSVWTALGINVLCGLLFKSSIKSS